MKHTNGIIFCAGMALLILLGDILLAQDKAKVADIQLTRDEAMFLLDVLQPRPGQSSFTIQGSEVDAIVEIKASLRTLAAQDTSKKVLVFPVTPAQRNLCLRAINLHQYSVALADALAEFKKKFESAANGKAKQ